MSEMASDVTGWREREVARGSTSWWGMVLALMVLATTYVAMYFAYVYVRVGVERWPPEGIDRPSLELAGLSVAALVASAAALAAGLWRLPAREDLRERLGLAGTLLLGAAHVALLWADWLDFGVPVGTHAYVSLYYLLPAVHAVVVVLGLLFALTLLAMPVAPAVVRREVGLRCLQIYWGLVVVAGVVLLAVVYLLPYVWPVV